MLNNKALLVIMLIGASTWAGCASAPNIDPQADQVLKRMSDTLGAAKSFSFHAVGLMDEVVETGQLSQFSRRAEILVVRPNKLHAKTDGDDISREIWFDGKTLALLVGTEKAYGTVQAPGSVEKMLDFIVEEYGLTIPLADLLFGDPYETLLANVLSGSYVGLHTVEGRPCHHLAFRQEVIDWQIWIDAGPTAVPRKLVITYKQEPGHPHYSATMDQWNLSAEASDDAFEFRPPDGFEQVDIGDLFAREEGE